MSHYTVLLDANVLYPAPMRDALMQLVISLRLAAPNAKTVGRATKLRRNRTVSRVVAGVFGALFTVKPDTALAELGCVGRGDFFVSIGLIL